MELKTNLLADSEIYRLIGDRAYKISNAVLIPNFKIKLDRLKQTYQQLIDRNFQGISCQDKITQKRILSELNQKFDDISDCSFLAFYDAYVPRNIEINRPSY